MSGSAWNLPDWNRTDSPYRSTAECAAFLGKMHRDGSLDLDETRRFLRAEDVQQFAVGRSVRYRRVDVERVVRPVGRIKRMRMVG